MTQQHGKLTGVRSFSLSGGMPRREITARCYTGSVRVTSGPGTIHMWNCLRSWHDSRWRKKLFSKCHHHGAKTCVGCLSPSLCEMCVIVHVKLTSRCWVWFRPSVWTGHIQEKQRELIWDKKNQNLIMVPCLAFGKPNLQRLVAFISTVHFCSLFTSKIKGQVHKFVISNALQVFQEEVGTQGAVLATTFPT